MCVGLLNWMPSSHQVIKNITKQPYVHFYMIKVWKDGVSKKPTIHEKKGKMCNWTSLERMTRAWRITQKGSFAVTMTVVIKLDDETAWGSELWEFGDGLELPNLCRWNLSPARLDVREEGKPQEAFASEGEASPVLFSPVLLNPPEGQAVRLPEISMVLSQTGIISTGRKFSQHFWAP